MISAELSAKYSAALSTAQDRCEIELLEILMECTDYGGSKSWTAVRRELAAVLEDYGAVARTAANEFFVEQAVEQGLALDAGTATVSRETSLQRVQVAANRAAGGGILKKAQALASLVQREADAQMIANSYRNHIKWGIVAHPGACEWCQMIASRGFDYASSETASSQRHDNCKCTVMADAASNPAVAADKAVTEYYDAGLTLTASQLKYVRHRASIAESNARAEAALRLWMQQNKKN